MGWRVRRRGSASDELTLPVAELRMAVHTSPSEPRRDSSTSGLHFALLFGAD
jgi:hypothetical protein